MFEASLRGEKRTLYLEVTAVRRPSLCDVVSVNNLSDFHEILCRNISQKIPIKLEYRKIRFRDSHTLFKGAN